MRRLQEERGKRSQGVETEAEAEAEEGVGVGEICQLKSRRRTKQTPTCKLRPEFSSESYFLTAGHNHLADTG